ncbi:mucin-2-like [Metopolophium dirhodum]|uniref:mucin-2-like n=1 Tax=Metopolophium dirhodum TaxID=44670 RepID=UPI00298F8607|nr:mucin-2-like [Metopolophium dirhodum]XP_060867554.1 mucin-2-like [Metopolophium dirhodum]
MSVRTSACLISLSILLGFILFVKGEHFYLPKENNDFSNDLQDDWVPVSGIDKRSTRVNNGFSQVVHITPPVRYTNRPLNLQPAASNKIEVFAQPPPTILGSFSEFGHATIEAREPAHTLNFRPSYNFDRHYEETNDRRFQQNDYNEPEDQKPPAIVVFNAQQRHPQNYQKPPPPQPPPQFYQNFQFHNINNNPNNYNNNPNNHNNNNNNNHNNHKSFGFKEPPIVQDPPKKLTPYYVPNDHIFPRPQGNNKQVYAEQRPKPYLVSPSDPIQQQPQQNKQQHQHQHQHHHHHHNQQQQQQLKQQQEQQQQYKSSTEGEPSAYFQKYPGHVENQNLYPQISNFARPFEQTNGDQNVFIKPNQYVHNLNVGTEVRFGQEHGSQPTRPVTVDLSTAFTHPATRPFSKYQTPTPKNEELYRIFPVKEVNALPAFLPTPVTLGHQQPLDGRPKAPYFKDATVGGSSEYDAREEQDENESSEQYDILKSPTKPMLTSTSTTTTTTTTVAPKTTRKRKPTTTTTTTTTTAVPDDYDEYAVPNRQQLQLQEHQQDYRPRQQYQQHQDYETVIVPTTEASTTYAPVREERPVLVSVNKFKKKKPLPSSRPKEPYPAVEYENVPERVTLAPTTTTTTAATTTAATTTTTTASQPSASDAAAADARAKIKSKYGNGTRPRFSIKDYKTSTTTTSTTAPNTEKASFTVGRRTTTTASPAPTDPETVEQSGNTTARKSYKPRARPNRYKAGTSTTTTTDEPQQQQQQDTTTERAYRSKYKPGKYYNRLRTSTDSAVAVVDEGSEPVAATEPTRPAVYSAKRRTVPTIRTAAVQPATVTAAEEHNGLRRSSSASPLDENTSEAMDAASSEDVDYVATTVAVTPAAPRHKYHTSYSADRPLLPIESFFQSSMASKRHHNEQR